MITPPFPNSLAIGGPVPNLSPTALGFSFRLAIVGEAPGEEECDQRKPFIGASGRVLDNILSQLNVPRAACLIASVCQYRPPGNKIELFSKTGPEFAHGLAELKKDLDAFQPNCILLLGRSALYFAKNGEDKIGNWRGSFFIGSGVFANYKCIATYHPAACLRQYKWMPILRMDIKRAFNESTSPELHLPIRDLHIDYDVDMIVSRLYNFIENSETVSCDIEGGLDCMSCISFASSSSYSFIVPLAKLDGSSYWSSLEEELRIWKALSAILASPKVKKILQNCLYDAFVLEYGYSCFVSNIVDDTMLKFWEQYCELEKSLAFQTSLLTKEPYYKSERKASDYHIHYTYCCKDSAVTFECNDQLTKLLTPTSKKHYEFNHSLLQIFRYIELRGIKYDTQKATQRLQEVDHHIHLLQRELDLLAGVGVEKLLLDLKEHPSRSETRPASRFEILLSKIQSEICYKKNPGQPKKDFEEAYPTIKLLIEEVAETQREFTPEEIGYLNSTIGWSMNIKGKDFKHFLYDVLKLPIQYNTNPETKVRSITTDYDALLQIQKSKTPHPAVALAIDIGIMRTRSQMLHIFADPDGRIRAGYNPVGTTTGRISCYTSPTGSGYNLQTIPDANSLRPPGHPIHKGMRDLFIADEGYFLFQCDLKGSDGWTIGAILNKYGSPTMLEDLRFGIKPASRICYMLRHGNHSLIGKQRDEIKSLLKEVKKDDWDYFACKVGIWGVCYLMGVDLLSDQIGKQSEGKVWLSRSEVTNFRQAVMLGYDIQKFHNWGTREVCPKRILSASNGFTRRFFGRSTDILGEILAHLPQVYTTYATNMAARSLWYDKENRIQDGDKTKLKIQPLHQVHDALIGQFPKEDLSWAVGKIKSYFNNPVEIAGQIITIPFDGNYGTNWAFDEESKVGNI